MLKLTETSKADVIKHLTNTMTPETMNDFFPYNNTYIDLDLPLVLTSYLKELQTNGLKTVFNLTRSFPFNCIRYERETNRITYVLESDYWKNHPELDRIAMKLFMIDYAQSSSYPKLKTFLRDEFVTNRYGPENYQRHEIKPTKFVKLLFPESTAQHAERFGQLADAYNLQWSPLSVREDMDIIEAYDDENYSDGNGSLQHSCMRKSSRLPFMDFYRRIGLRIATFSDPSSGLVRARALIWPNITLIVDDGTADDDTETKAITLMDRIYTTNEADLTIMQAYANQKGYYSKKHQNYSSPKELQRPDGTFINGKLFYTFDGPLYKGFPYMDTMAYLNTDSPLFDEFKNFILTNHKRPNQDNYELRNLDGEGCELAKYSLLSNGSKTFYSVACDHDYQIIEADNE